MRPCGTRRVCAASVPWLLPTSRGDGRVEYVAAAVSWAMLQRALALVSCMFLSACSDQGGIWYLPCRKLSSLNLQQQQLGGTLPPEFGFNTSFPALTNLILMQNQLSGGCGVGCVCMS